MGWVEDKPTFDLDGYVDWELADASVNPRATERPYVPVQVTLNPDPDTNWLEKVIAELSERSADYILPLEERASLLAELERDTDEVRTVGLYFYCLPELVQNPLWTVQHIGAPVILNKSFQNLQALPVFIPTDGTVSTTPIVAVIDDGIGFLNMRFRSSLTSSRFMAVWVQSSSASFNPAAVATVPSGVVLTTADINAMLTSGRDEADEYRAFNNAVFGPDDHKGTNLHVGHGTHVLDLAAGAKPGSAESAVPLLAVQLAPASIAETSGRRLDPSIAASLRWVINQALLAVGRNGQGRSGIPLIINLSLGSLAGPKNGKGELEIAINREIARYQALAPNTPIRVVAAYGNAHRARLVAGKKLNPEEQLTLDWRIQPDDWTSSFLEVRVPVGRGGDVGITLTPPMGATSLSLSAFPMSGTVYNLATSSGTIASLRAGAKEGFDLLQIKVYPTAGDTPAAKAPAGVWTVAIENKGSQKVEVSAKVRRDDTPAGFRRAGRQSWLDHATGWEWDNETMDWVAPAQSSPVMRQGTEVSFAAVKNPSVYFVASVRPDTARDGGYRSSRYSAEGEAANQTGPSISAISDEGQMVSGLRATGVLTGSTARLSGTSMAAPLLVREFMENVLGGIPMPANISGRVHDPVELTALVSKVINTLPVIPPHPRVGSGILNG